MRACYFVIGLALAWSASVSAGQVRQTSSDMPGRFFPGKYFEWKAQFYLKKKDYRIALQLADLASYWGDKTAQYNLGIMYYNGIGITADKARGAAWLRIAAEAHNPLAVQMLGQANAELTPQQRASADTLWQALDKKYGDTVTLPRVRANFETERRNVTGSRVGAVGNMKVIYGGPGGSDNGATGSDFYANQQAEFDEYIQTNFGQGHVDVGAIESVAAPAENTHDAAKNIPDTPR